MSSGPQLRLMIFLSNGRQKRGKKTRLSHQTERIFFFFFLVFCISHLQKEGVASKIYISTPPIWIVALRNRSGMAAISQSKLSIPTIRMDNLSSTFEKYVKIFFCASEYQCLMSSRSSFAKERGKLSTILHQKRKVKSAKPSEINRLGPEIIPSFCCQPKVPKE